MQQNNYQTNKHSTTKIAQENGLPKLFSLPISLRQFHAKYLFTLLKIWLTISETGTSSRYFLSASFWCKQVCTS
jgi:hypothetical protein